jgi:high potential iron-sulfur protein
MENDPSVRSATLSRRGLLRNVAVAGGAAVLGTAISHRAEAAQVSQKIVAYQDTPHGAQQCDNCAQFQPPSACKVVEGTISPTGWCKVYVKKPAS